MKDTSPIPGIQTALGAALAPHVQRITPQPDAGTKTAFAAEGMRANSDGTFTANDGGTHKKG